MQWQRCVGRRSNAVRVKDTHTPPHELQTRVAAERWKGLVAEHAVTCSSQALVVRSNTVLNLG